MNWPQRRLGDLMEFRNGLSYSAADRGEGLPIVGVADVSRGGRLPSGGFETIRTPASLPEAALLKPGDLLFVRSNGSRDLVGRCAEVGELDAPTSHSGFTIRARVIDPAVNPKWIAAFFDCGLGNAVLGRGSRGTNINNLRQERLQGITLRIPPRPEQDRVLGHTARFDDAIANIESLHIASRTLGKELVRRLINDGSNGTADVAAPFGDIVQLVSDRQPHPQEIGCEPCVELEHIERDSGRLLQSTRETISHGERTRFLKGDTLVGRLRPYLRKYYFAEQDGFCSTEIWVLRPLQKYLVPAFLPILIQADAVRRAMNKTSGTKMPRAEWHTVSRAVTYLPSRSKQQQIVAAFKSLNTKMEVLRQMHDRLLQHRRAVHRKILQHLMS